MGIDEEAKSALDRTDTGKAETENSELSQIVRRSAAGFDALREFVQVVGSILVERIPKDLNEFERASAAFFICSEAPIDSLPLPSEMKAAIKRIKEQPIEKTISVCQTAGLPIKVTGDGGRLEIDEERLDAERLVSESRLLQRSNLQHKLLYESSLMALTSQSEWLISQLMRLFFERFPSAAGDDEKFFSLQDLEGFNSIREARDALIESRVEQQMRLSLDDWIKFFRQKTRLSFDFLEPKLPVLREVFQRRNLIVHNGGLVNSFYLDRVDPELRKGLKLGDKIIIQGDYLQKAIDAIESEFVLIVFELWRKWDKTSSERSTTLLTFGYEHMVAGRWDISRKLFAFLMNDTTATEARRLQGRINYWQSFKWTGEYESIRADVESTDYSAKAPVFRLALHALRDEYEEFFQLLPQVLKSDELKIAELRTWPLFRSVREQQQYRIYSENTEIDSTGVEPIVQ